MSMKYNFTIMRDEANPIMGLMIEINQATNGIFILALLIMVYGIATYSFLKRTQDIGKSCIMGLHIVVLLSILLFYGGLTAGYTLIPQIWMLGLILLEAGALAGSYFLRSKGL